VITTSHEALRKDFTVTRKKKQQAGRKIGVTEVAGGIIRQLADIEIENIIDSVDSNRVVGRHRGPLLFLSQVRVYLSNLPWAKTKITRISSSFGGEEKGRCVMRWISPA
jgi:hypothetical protein